MKYVLEFGRRRGAHTDNVVLPSKKLANQIATGLVHAFSNTPNGTVFHGDKSEKRTTWSDETFFVALSVLDGVDRGPASAELWK